MIITDSVIHLLDWEKMNGMIPAIAQDLNSGQVLMMAYMNRIALESTLKTGKATFFSRQKQALWCKGESSGNILYVEEISTDCDKDTLLLMVRPTGPACHLGTTSCWNDASIAKMTFLHYLENIIAKRQNDSPQNSYTAFLCSQGINRIAQKVGEEGVETALAAVCEQDHKVINETADLLYHLLVMLNNRKIPLALVVDELITRHLNDK